MTLPPPLPSASRDPTPPPACLPPQVASGNPSAVLRPSIWKQRTAAHLAARAGSAAALAVVLDVAGHAAGGLPTHFLNAPDHAGDTALALAAKHGCVGGWEEALKWRPAGCFICCCMATGRAPAPAYRALPFAPSRLPTLQPSRSIHCRHADCVRELLEAGASPLPANMQGATALHYAAARGQAACIRLLLSAPVRLPGAPAGLPAGIAG